jgi:hypothetical protein
LPATVKENLLLDVKNFISEDEKAWYSSKGTYPGSREADREGSHIVEGVYLTDFDISITDGVVIFSTARRELERRHWVRQEVSIGRTGADHTATAVASKLRLTLYCVSPAAAG